MNLQDSSTPLHIHSRHMLLFFSIICFYLYKKKKVSKLAKTSSSSFISEAEAPSTLPHFPVCPLPPPPPHPLENLKMFLNESSTVAHMQPLYTFSHTDTQSPLTSEQTINVCACVYASPEMQC